MKRLLKDKFVPFYRIRFSGLSRAGNMHLDFFGDVRAVTRGPLEFECYGGLRDLLCTNLLGAISANEEDNV